MAIQRVAQRVRNGGHDIPKEVVLRRIKQVLITFSIFICLVWTIGYWQIIAKTPRIIVAEGGRGMKMHIHHIERFNKIQSYVRE